MKIEDFKPWLKAPFSNMVPVAVIGSINPDFALHKDEVFFTGYGIDDGAIRRYIWISDIDGEIWNSTETADFNTTNLSRGAHVITLIVLDNFGIRSNEVSGTLHINEKPKAIIETISPNPALDVDTVTFTCSGSDDGSVSLYVWNSSIDGVIQTSSAPSFSLSNLSNGTHVILLRVRDNHGVWSNEVSSTLVVNGRPRAIITSVAPNPSNEGQSVTFIGSGTDDGTITTFLWKEGETELYNGSNTSFTSTDLSAGMLTITLQVQDNNGIWSEIVPLEIEVIEVVTDSDGDGVADESDAFPNDPVASKDSDGDGYPDEWNTGKSQTDSTTGLKLDYYPDDPKKWKKDSGGESGESEGGIPGFEVITVVGAIGVTMMQYRRKGKDLVNPGRVHFDFL